MKILLIGNKDLTQSQEKFEDYYKGYIEFFNSASAKSQSSPQIDFCFIDDLIIEIGDGDFSILNTKSGNDISSYEALLIRGGGLRDRADVIKVISSYANLKKVKIVNDYSSTRNSSKLVQALQFHELEIPVAKTVYLTEALLKSKVKLGIGFPCIMKATMGAHGNDNYLVNNIEEIEHIQSKSPTISFVLQRFVPNDGDFRLLIIGENVLVIGRHAVNGSHLNNTSQGGTVELGSVSDIPSEVVEQAKKVSKYLDMTFAGVDVLEDKDTGKYYFLEVNSQPQLMTGAFVDKKIDSIANFFDTL